MPSEISEGIFLCIWGRGLFRRFPVGPSIFPVALPVCAAERSVEICIVFETALQISLVRHGSLFQQFTHCVEPLLHQVTINTRTSLLTEFVHQVIFADEELLCQLVYGQRVRHPVSPSSVKIERSHTFGQILGSFCKVSIAPAVEKAHICPDKRVAEVSVFTRQ